MHVLVICKYKKDRIKNNQEKVETSFSHNKSMGAFCCHENPTPVMLHIKFDQDSQPASEIFKFKSVKCSSLKGKLLQNERSDLVQNRNRPSFYACPGYKQL